MGGGRLGGRAGAGLPVQLSGTRCSRWGASTARRAARRYKHQGGRVMSAGGDRRRRAVWTTNSDVGMELSQVRKRGMKRQELSIEGAPRLENRLDLI